MQNEPALTTAPRDMVSAAKAAVVNAFLAVAAGRVKHQSWISELQECVEQEGKNLASRI